jgi:hypothetical protein
MLRAYPKGRPPKKNCHTHFRRRKRLVKTKRVVKRKSGKPTVVQTERIAKRKNGKYKHPQDKWIALRAKMREANLREEKLIRKTAEILRKVLPDYTAERQAKNAVQESDTPIDSCRGNSETRKR